MKDFLILQKAAHKIEFDQASRLFLQKWKLAEPDFCAYFQKEWLKEDTKNWYAGYSSFVPDHNNAQEGFNQHIKRDHTLRERLHLNEFKVAFMQMIHDMSVCYDPDNLTGNVKKIQDQPYVTNSLYQLAHAWYLKPDLIMAEKKNEWAHKFSLYQVQNI